MVLSSYNFIIFFLPIVLIGFYFLLKYEKYTMKLSWLVISSFFFFTCSFPQYLSLLIANIIVNYYLAKLIKLYKSSLLLTLSIVMNVLLLFYFKYMNFGISICNLILNTQFKIKDIVLPLGISFITFQQIAFLVGTYKGTYKEKINIIEYALFVSFFPHISSGPIITQEYFMPIIKNKSMAVDWDKFASGIFLFFFGLGKKVLLADVLAKGVDYGYSNLDGLNATSGLFISLIYTIQIYYDFSGYSDMAIGIARMLQLDLPINFNSPYKATSVTEFWKRWHITLTKFLTQYIYIPLGGNRKGKIRSYINIIVVFVISGLWHGASYTFIIWGLIHGIFMVLEKQFGKKFQVIPKWIKHVVTFFFINFTWIIFRANSLQTIKKFLLLFHSDDWGKIDGNILENILPTFIVKIFPDFCDKNILGVVFFLIILFITLLAKNTQEIIRENKYNLVNLVGIVFIGIISVFSLSGINSFIYAYF